MGVRSFLLVAALASLTLSSPLKQRSDSLDTARKFDFIGVNESGPEFGEDVVTKPEKQNQPGVGTGRLGKEFQWPEPSTIDTFIKKGMNTFRINILAERLIADSGTSKFKAQNGPIDKKYMDSLNETVNYITQKGAYAMIVPHNYGRWYGKVINDVAGFEAYWKTLATPFAENEKVIFDTNNEFHDMDQNLVVRLNQAAINGIRGVGAKTQWIHVEGNSWTGAWTWTKSGNGATMAALTDPSNKIMYQMHQYLDTDGSGTHAECVSRTIGVERLKDATNWLKQHKKVGIIGEFAGGNNEQCKAAIKGMLEYMGQNRDVWKGALWWAAGPWWKNYMYSIEPGTGPAYNAYLDLLMSYA